jgi:integrase
LARKRREKGTGSIFVRGEQFVAQVQDGFTDAGRPRYRQVRCKTRTEAVRALNELTSLKTQGKRLVTKAGLTVGSWLDHWLEQHVRPNREPKTYSFYRLMAGKIQPHIGRFDLSKLTPEAVSKLFTALEEGGASQNTILAVRRTLRAACGVALRFGYIHDNPVPRTFAPKVRRGERVYFDADQIQKLFLALEESPIENLVRFTLATGMRLGESTGVTWTSIDFKSQTVVVRNQLQRVDGSLRLKPLKTARSLRTLPLIGHSAEAVEMEHKRQAQEQFENSLNLVFLNPLGLPFDPKYVSKHLHRALRKAGLPITGIHSLRHSAATFMLMAGLNLHQVSRYLGHSQITLTSNLYGHVLDSAMKEAAVKLQQAYD